MAAASAADARAIGYVDSGLPLVVHWNGATWRAVPITLPGSTRLEAVAVSSPDNAWIVGLTGPGTPTITQTSEILHWNGSSWSRVPSAPAAAGPQIAVAATATDDAWLLSTVAGRWNGTDWTTVPVPLVTMHGDGRGGQLLTLAASGSTAWVAGTYCTSPFTCANGEALPMLLRWDGSSWQQTSPLPSAVTIFGVAATSPANAWAVGYTWATDKRPNTTLILHWNGTTWS